MLAGAGRAGPAAPRPGTCPAGVLLTVPRPA